MTGKKKVVNIWYTQLWDGLIAIKDDTDGETRIITETEFNARYVTDRTRRYDT